MFDFAETITRSKTGWKLFFCMTLVSFSGPTLAQELEGEESDNETAQETSDQSAAAPDSTPAAPAEASPIPSTETQEKPRPQTQSEMPRVESTAPRKTMFGTYRLRLSVNKPSFTDDVKYYDDLYGTPKNYGMFGADWFAWDWYVTFGLGLRTGFYAANGERVKGGSVNKAKPDPSVFEKTGKTSLTVLPVQALLTMEFTPFQGKWLVIDGWFGAEYAYWQEVRVEEASASTGTTKSSILMATAATGSDEGSLTNKGWAPATVLGFAANILLNPLDDRSARSMGATMGLGYVYLSPFMEVVTSTRKDRMNWSRKVFGLGFTFESLK